MTRKPDKPDSFIAKHGSDVIVTNDYMSTLSILRTDYEYSGGTKSKNHLFLCGTHDWSGSWDNAIKILES